MSEAFTVTSELIYEPDHNWTFIDKKTVYNDTLEEVEVSEILTGERAFAQRADQVLEKYAAHVEARKQHLMALARNLLAGAEVG